MIEITTTRWDMVGGHMRIHNGRKCVQGPMGYNMEGDVDFNKGVRDKMGWKKGGNSGGYNNK